MATSIQPIASSCIEEVSTYSSGRGGTVQAAWLAFLSAYSADLGSIITVEGSSRNVPEAAPSGEPGRRPGAGVGYYNGQVKALLRGNSEGLTVLEIAKGIKKHRDQMDPTIASLERKGEIRRLAHGRYALTSVIGAASTAQPAARGQSSTAGEVTMTAHESAVVTAWRELGGTATRPQIYDRMTTNGTLAAGGKAIRSNHLARTLGRFVDKEWATKSGDPETTTPSDLFSLNSID